MATSKTATNAALVDARVHIMDMICHLPNMHIISVNFINKHIHSDIASLHDALYNFAGKNTPFHIEDINKVFSNEMLDKYISDEGDVTIKSSADLDILKESCISHYYECQLFEDRKTIIKCLYLYILLENIETNETLQRDLPKLTNEQLKDAIEGLADNIAGLADNDAICMDDLVKAISDAVEEEE